jgi:monoamine oxidase
VTDTSLRGVKVVVAGAGLAGLSAAHALETSGADVTVVEARDRVGGRVWTWRTGFQDRQHAEAGGDLIEAEQEATIALAKSLGLKTTLILRRGFGYYGPNARGQLAIQKLDSYFDEVERPFHSAIHDYTLSEERWDGAVAAALAAESIAERLIRADAPAWVRSRVRGLRGLFLADPEDLSTLALVDFFAEFGSPGSGRTLRVADGNDRLATGLARKLKRRPELRTVLHGVEQTERGIIASVEGPGGLADLGADYLVCTLPATTARDVRFEPSLPDRQQDAIARLRYGPATRLVLQFGRRFWNKPGRPNAFGTDQSFGAVWDANEQQRGPRGLLSFLAGGTASRELQSLLRAEGPDGVAAQLKWLGRPGAVLASRSIAWEDDPWARGGYAYFDPRFDPALRDWLARPAGRIVFAGEHTSIKWQGYINGAILSGQRAAAEIKSFTSQSFTMKK